MANNVILPLLITKATSIIPNQKEERIDAARNFTVKATNVSLAQNDSLIIVVSQKTNIFLKLVLYAVSHLLPKLRIIFAFV